MRNSMVKRCEPGSTTSAKFSHLMAVRWTLGSCLAWIRSSWGSEFRTSWHGRNFASSVVQEPPTRSRSWRRFARRSLGPWCGDEVSGLLEFPLHFGINLYSNRSRSTYYPERKMDSVSFVSSSRAPSWVFPWLCRSCFLQKISAHNTQRMWKLREGLVVLAGRYTSTNVCRSACHKIYSKGNIFGIFWFMKFT